MPWPKTWQEACAPGDADDKLRPDFDSMPTEAVSLDSGAMHVAPDGKRSVELDHEHPPAAKQ